MILSDAFDLFMYEQRFRNNSPATVAYYNSYLTEFLNWLKTYSDITEVEQLTVKEYKDYVIFLSSGDLKASSVNTKIRAVKAFYNFLIDEERIGDCSRKLKLIKQRREEIIPLTDSEIRLLLESFDTSDLLELRNMCFVLLMLDCGLRRSELIRLKVSDVDFIRSSLLVNGKGDKQRLVPMGDNTSSVMLQYNDRVSDRRSGKPTDPFFLDRFGNGIDINCIKMVFQDLKTRTGIQRLHPHLLRHTFATLYIVDGGNLEVLRCLLGHSSIAITQIYLHLASNYIILKNRHNSHIDNLNKEYK